MCVCACACVRACVRACAHMHTCLSASQHVVIQTFSFRVDFSARCLCLCVCFSFGFTFLVNNREDKSKNNYFGHCVALPSEEEMYRWVSALLVAQVPHLLLLLLFVFSFSFFGVGWGGIQRIVFLASPHLLWLFFRWGRGWGLLGEDGRWGSWFVFRGGQCKDFFSSIFPCFALVVAPKQCDITGMLWRGRVYCTSWHHKRMPGSCQVSVLYFNWFPCPVSRNQRAWGCGTDEGLRSFAVHIITELRRAQWLWVNLGVAQPFTYREGFAVWNTISDHGRQRTWWNTHDVDEVVSWSATDQVTVSQASFSYCCRVTDQTLQQA